MIDSRSDHACGKFKIGDQIVLIVAGYPGTYVEFLPLNETKWITGNDSIHLIEKSLL
mgnify:CR=1 FL=1